MAPNKFEEHLKEKLNARTLQPSPDAWNKLSERLDNQPKKNKNNSYWWLGLAASIVGVFLVTTFFNNENTVVEDNPVIVNNPEPTKNLEQNNSHEPDLKVSKTPIISDEKINQKQVVVINNSDIQTLELKKETVKSAEVAVKKLTFEEQKIQDVVAQIQVLKDSKSEVTDSEIDALLLNAQKEINLNKLYTNKGLVDAKSLLQDVEADIDQSFRSKVFEVLKDSYGTVKSAVVNRNN